MRRVAPDRPGKDASQNSWSVVYLKPTVGSLATTTLHTIHTAKASNRHGIDLHKLRWAMRLPVLAQKSGSYVRQSLIAAPVPRPCLAASWIPSSSANCGRSRSEAHTSAL